MVGKHGLGSRNERGENGLNGAQQMDTTPGLKNIQDFCGLGKVQGEIPKIK